MDYSAPGHLPSDRQPIAPTLRPARSPATGDRTRPFVVAQEHVRRRILIAEDEPGIAELLEKGLRANGFTTVHSPDGREALGLADGGEFDLLILDIGLPGLDGFDVLVDLRSRGATLPVIVLTGRRDRDVGEFLAEGADDYLSKPFRFDELLARIRARLREGHGSGPTGLDVGVARLDLRTRRLTVGSRTVDLTAREFALAHVFFRHPGQVLSREFLLSHVWGTDFDPGSNIVRIYVRNLRRKLGEQPITTVRGMGYRLEEDEGRR